MLVPVINSSTTLPLPNTLQAPLRPHLIQEVHKCLRTHLRQPYAVSETAGKQHSAVGWGTGRAVARVPRVKGSGTRRAGEAAFANFARKGRMAHPTTTHRRWFLKVNKRCVFQALQSALTASTNEALVQARGHLVNTDFLPIVVSDDIHNIVKTKEANAYIKNIGLEQETLKSKESKRTNSGLGKMRNRRYKKRRGMLIIHDNEEIKAFRNLPGIEQMSIREMDLLKVAPGGIGGRLIVWTESAFKNLDCAMTDFLGKQERVPGRILRTKDNLMDIFYSDKVQALLETPLHDEWKKDGHPESILAPNKHLYEMLTL